MSLVIDDSHIDALKQYIMTQSSGIDSLINRYIRTMNTVIAAGFMEGATSEALKEFLKEVESDVGKNNSNPGHLKVQSERFCINFIKKVDKADKELY